MSKNYSADESRLPLDPPADALPLDAVAVIDAFASDYERGAAPELSEWLRRYPEHAEALANYTAAMLAEPEIPSASAGMEQANGELVPGTQRALDSIFGAPPMARPANALPRVAEQSASYDARAANLFALAEAHGLDVEQLARALGMSVEEVERALTVSGDSASMSRAQGDSVPDSIPLEEAIRRSERLSAKERARWLDLLQCKGVRAPESDREHKTSSES